jgi:uncharacterized protein
MSRSTLPIDLKQDGQKMSFTKAIRRLFLTALGVTMSVTSIGAPAEVRLTPEVGGANYAVRVMSWADIPFRSVVRQQYDFSCGSAALATLLSFHYQRPTPESVPFKAMWDAGEQARIRKSGFSMLDMKHYMTKQGLRTEGFKLTIDQLAKTARPGIVLINLAGFKHFVVLKGIQNGRVLVGDPIIGITNYAMADFGKIWNGILLAVVEPDKGARPIFNLASDWGPWSRAPMEQNAQMASIGDITNDLPPMYQITPQILLDVRVGTVR